jgi:hypothetical protein
MNHSAGKLTPSIVVISVFLPPVLRVPLSRLSQ